MKRYILILFSVVFCLTSCEDMLDIDSSRYVEAEDDNLSSANDSVFSVLGILRGIQDVAERYILFGEMRADLLEVTDFTPAAIRELSTFSVQDTSSYANPQDYYTIINNCNFFISKTSGDKHPLKKENALVRSIRAWVYMQIAFNWGKVYYCEEPLLSVDDVRNLPKVYTINQLLDALISDLEPLVGALFPNYGNIYTFRSTELFFQPEVLLGDLYLWRGGSVEDYEMAATYYSLFIDKKVDLTGSTTYFTNRIQWNYDNFLLQNFETAVPSTSTWRSGSVARSGSNELITAIQMATSEDEGRTTRQFWGHFESFTYSSVIASLWEKQDYVLHYLGGTTAVTYYTTGDLREAGNVSIANIYNEADGEMLQVPMLYKIYMADHVLIYRIALIYLRYAEAVNRAGKPHTAFAVLKYGLSHLTLPDTSIIPEEEFADRKSYMTVFNSYRYEEAKGIHSRGCGDSAYDALYVIGRGEELGPDRSDTIRWVEEAICEELALETSFEGNRFQDLMRMAMRRNDPSFLAKRVAAKHESDYDRIYQLLLNTDNWFLPEPKK